MLPFRRWRLGGGGGVLLCTVGRAVRGDMAEKESAGEWGGMRGSDVEEGGR